jgi:rubrerythrin
MAQPTPFDPFLEFAEIERLASKIYYRFSHLFLDQPELRDFWWDMAKEEEEHALVLLACRKLISSYEDEKVDPEINREKAKTLARWLLDYLRRGTASLTVDEAFRIALEVESSEINVIYEKLVHLGGPEIAKTLESLGVPASAQRLKLKRMLRRFCTSRELLQAAAKL